MSQGAARSNTAEAFPALAVALLGVTQLAAWGGLYYAITLLASRIMAETGWASSVVHGGFSAALIAAAIAGPQTGRWLDRLGAGRVMAGASVLAAIGLSVLALSSHPAIYLFGWVLCGLSVAGTLYDPAFVALAQIAPGRARAAVTALTLIGGFASTLSWPLIFALLKHMDWRGVFFVFAGFQLLVSAPIYFLLIARMTKPRPPGEAPLPGPTPMIQGSLARSPYFWAVALCFAINTYITTALTLHLVPALSSVAEIGEAQAVLIGMAFGPAQVAARVAELLFLRRHSAFALALFSFGLMPFALAAIALATMSPDVAFVATAVAGASNGLMTIARGILPLALFGRENFGANLGLFVLPGRIAMAAAPVTFAWLLAAVNVPAAFTYLLGGAIISFVAMIALSRFR